MTDTKITGKLNESEIVEAIDYMYGFGNLKEAEKALEDGKFTKDDIYRAVAYYRTVGLPIEMKREQAKKELPKVIRTYENLI